jgi:hypothetical protein
MTEVYLLFYQAALQLFIRFNQFLQREDPIICAISAQIVKFLKNLFGKFVTIQAITDARNDITNVSYKEEQLPGKTSIFRL